MNLTEKFKRAGLITGSLSERTTVPRYIYVAGPFTSDPAGNTERAGAIARELHAAGWTPFVPHGAFGWAIPLGEPAILAQCFAWIARCEALVYDAARMPGPSSGTPAEINHARSLGLAIFFSVEEAVSHGR